MRNPFGVAWLLLGIVAAPGLALAADDPPAGGEETTPTPAPIPAPTPAPTPNPFETATPDGDLPEWGLGVGLGWNFPADLGTPNTASLRIRKGSFTLEPAISVVAAGSISEDKVDQGPDSSDRVGGWTTTIAFGARKQMATRGRVGLIGILVPSVTYADFQSNPQGTDNAVRVTSFGTTLSWGLGVEYSPLPEWSLSLDATNPLAAVTSVRTFEMATNFSERDTAFAGGLSLDPEVRAMAHLHF